MENTINNHIKNIVFSLAIMLTVIACTSTSESENVNVENLNGTAEKMASTMVALTSQVMFPTATLTYTPTLVPTSTFTLTATMEPAALTLIEEGDCLMGPYQNFRVVETLSVGFSAMIEGETKVTEDEGERTWYVIYATGGEELCWLNGILVEVRGDLSSLIAMESPATPTLEPTSVLTNFGLVYYLIFLDTGGPVGCGDSLIPVYSGIKSTNDTEKDIVNVLNALFSLKTEYVDGLYNAMYESDLRAKTAEINGRVATVYTRGKVVKPKDDCDKERYRVQVFFTVRNFSQVDRAIIWANNALLGDLLEQGGK